MNFRCVSILMVISLGGCVTAAETAQNVQIVKDSGSVAGCRDVGQVDAGSLMGGALTSIGYQNTISELKQKVAQRGGTHVLLVDMSSGHAGSNALGQAYKCGS